MFIVQHIHRIVNGFQVWCGLEQMNIYLYLVPMIVWWNYGILVHWKLLCMIFKDMMIVFFVLIGLNKIWFFQEEQIILWKCFHFNEKHFVFVLFCFFVFWNKCEPSKVYWSKKKEKMEVVWLIKKVMRTMSISVVESWIVIEDKW